MGGVARKSPFIMQMMADVMDMPIRYINPNKPVPLVRPCLLQQRRYFHKVEEAMDAMGPGFDAEYHPNPEKFLFTKSDTNSTSSWESLLKSKQMLVIKMTLLSRSS
jgi:L-ribulokinase